MEKLLNQISSELSNNELDPNWISVIDSDYAYGQMKLSPETSKHCNFANTGEKTNGYYRFLKGFYGPADIPTIFQEKIDRTLGHQIPVWLDDILIVKRGTKEEHTQNVESALTKLENEGYKASKTESNFYKKNCMAGTHHLTGWNKTKQRKNRCYQQTEPTDEYKNAEIIPRSNTVFP